MSRTVEHKYNSFGYDRRNSITKASKIIKDLREMDFTEGQPIIYDDVIYFVNHNFGLDPRTEKKYLKILERLDYLVPAPGSKPVVEISRMTITTPNKIGFRDFRTVKGHSSYVFGSRAPRLYEETLNPKYVPPIPPANTNDKVKDTLVRRTNGEDSQKNMCVLREPKQAQQDSPSKKDENGKVINNNNNTVLHTHILNTVIDEADKILHAKPGPEPNKGSLEWENGVKPPLIIPPMAPEFYAEGKKRRGGPK